MERQSQKIDVVVAAAEKYFGGASEELQGVFSGGVPSTQPGGKVH